MTLAAFGVIPSPARRFLTATGTAVPSAICISRPDGPMM
jgi:hypothetical protein